MKPLLIWEGSRYQIWRIHEHKFEIRTRNNYLLLTSSNQEKSIKAAKAVEKIMEETPQ